MNIAFIIYKNVGFLKLHAILQSLTLGIQIWTREPSALEIVYLKHW